MVGAMFSDISITSVLVTIILACVCLYLWTFTKCQYWKSRGVPYLKPVLPVFGNLYDLLLLRSLPEITNRIYNETKGFPYIGFYACHTPVLFLRGVDIIAKVLVNDFNHFEDRGFHFNVNDSLGRNLIHQKGLDWKFSRSKLAPCFNITRIKSMLVTMKNKSEILVEKLEKEQLSKSFIEIWDVSLRYTTDVLTMCTIGIDANSLQNQNEPFREAGSHLLGAYFNYHVFTGCFFPKLHKFLGISVAKSKVKQFFHEVVNQVLKYRKDDLFNKDILQTLIQMKKESKSSELDSLIPEIDDNFIVGQIFIFFLAGFETPGNILACSLYEIAKNPQIQKNALTEITNVLKKYNGEVTFEALQDMKYLRQVVSETLRKYTPLTLIFRRCTKDYTIPGTSTVIERGTLVLVPLRSIQQDPEHYPNPEVFDPERFSEENSAARHIGAFIPFGIGPRFCPALLYSHIKIRMALVYILRQFEICMAENTPTCLQATPQDFLMTPKNGIPLAFKKRLL